MKVLALLLLACVVLRFCYYFSCPKNKPAFLSPAQAHLFRKQLQLHYDIYSFVFCIKTNVKCILVLLRYTDEIRIAFLLFQN